MSRSKSRPDGYEFAIDDPESIAKFTEHLSRVVPPMQQYRSADEFASALPALLAEKCRELVSLLAPFNPLDIVDLMRQREVPLRLSEWKESTSDQNLAHVDLVALAVLARRDCRDVERSSADPRPVLEKAREICRDLIALAVSRFQYESLREDLGPLRDLAAQTAGHTVTVRNWQYLTIQDEFNRAVLADETVKPLMLGSVNFDYEDFLDVRAAVSWSWQEGIHQELDVVRAAAEAFPLDRGVSPDEATKAAASTALDRAFVHPGARAVFTAQEIASITGRPESRVRAVLDAFAVNETELDAPPEQLLQRALHGSRPSEGKQLFRVDGDFLGTGTPIGTDSLRIVVETSIKADQKAWKRYERVRADAAENLALSYLGSLLGAQPAMTAFEYWSPESDTDFPLFGPDQLPPAERRKRVEADGLFLLEDLAICVEVKAGGVTELARRGHIPRLIRDLRKTVGDAVAQAERLECLISNHHGLWLADETWLDLSHIAETRSIAVCLDDLGVLGTSVDTLARAGIFRSPQLAWVVSLHDLRVIAMVLDEPAEFLLYVRRRTDVGVTTRFRAVDELDLFMYFLEGNLFVEPDPEVLYAKYPTSGPPTAQSRRRYQSQPEVRRIGTFTDPLDAWIYGQEEERDEVEKPSFKAVTGVSRLVASMRSHNVPGALRIGADLLGLASDAQAGLMRAILKLLRAAEADGKPHTLFYTWVGSEGYTALAFGTCPPYETVANRFERLRLYVDAKKYQLRVDRALVLLLDAVGTPIAAAYNNAAVQEDGAMEALVEEMGLLLTARNVAVPPSARRTTKKLRGKPKGRN